MRNQKGFSLVRGLIIITIIGVVGFAGWRVANNSGSFSSLTGSDSDQNL